MLRRGFTTAAAAFFLMPPKVTAEDAAPATVDVALRTTLGDIVLVLESGRAPATTKNFLKYVDQKRLDGASFYRAMKVKDDTGIIQGGDNSRALPGCRHEATSQTGLSHTDGVISLARGRPGTAQGDFFICLGDMTAFDAGQDGTADGLGFAAFGHVAEGMEVVRAIFAAPVSKTRGIGVMKGQMLSPPVKIVSARRARA